MSVAAPDARSTARVQAAAGDAFTVMRHVGRGAFADVYEARDARLKRRVALKVLRDELCCDARTTALFRHEAEAIAAVRHPHILPIHDIGEGNGLVFLVLDWADGESLGRHLDRAGMLPIDEVVRILRQVAGALAAAHDAGIVHRDLKPDNVMLDGEQRRVLLMDFGLARAAGADDETNTTRTIVGTPQYMSPEQAAGDRVDHRADLYAFGVLGYRMLTGRLPFGGTTGEVLIAHMTQPPTALRSLRPDCPQWLASVIDQGLIKDPAQRWESARHIEAALDQQSMGSARPADTSRDVEPRATSRPIRDIGVAAAVATGAVALDVAVTGTLTASPLLVLGAAAAAVLRYARIRATSRAPGAESDDIVYGRHDALVRAAQLERTNLMRALALLSHQEQRLVRPVVNTADRLLTHVVQAARRLGAIDERIATERVALQPVGVWPAGDASMTGAGGPPRRVMDELFAGRARTQADVERSLGVLAQLRHAAAQVGRDGPGQHAVLIEDALRQARAQLGG